MSLYKISTNCLISIDTVVINGLEIFRFVVFVDGKVVRYGYRWSYIGALMAAKWEVFKPRV